MKVGTLGFYICLMLWPTINHAEVKIDGQTPAVVVRHNPLLGEALQLQADQASLRTVLDELSRVSGAAIHYSVLADELVTATCVADSLKKLLKCLLGDTQNIVFQYAQDEGKTGMPVDVWILGSSLAEPSLQNHRDTVNCKGESIGSASLSRKQDTEQADAQLIAQLLLRLETDDPKQRADAIADLATKTAIDNADVHDVLLNAMDDKSAMVREQALFGWAYRKGKGTTFELQQALQDPEMSVRMKVVDLTEDRALLTQAVTDNNELVRQLAQMKLEALAQQTNEK